MNKETKLIPLTESHQTLLEARGLDMEKLANLGWQTCASRNGDWIAIPYLRNDRIVNYKYRTIGAGKKQFSQESGAEQCFYNLDAFTGIDAMDAKDQAKIDIVITEGEMDCAAALQCGYLAVSVPNGAPDKPIDSEDSTKFDYLKDFPRFAVAVLAVDDDPAGMVLRQELALRLGWHRCKWVKYPKRRADKLRKCKDLNEVLQDYGAEGVRKVFSKYTNFMDMRAGQEYTGLFRMNELPEQPDVHAFECGIGNVSSMIKLRPGDCIVVTGIPGHGKTTFTNCVGANMNKLYGWPVCFGSFEQSPRVDHLRYLRTYFLEKPQYAESGAPLWSAAEMALADEWINQNFTFIVPDVNDDQLTTIKWVLTRARQAITQHGARLLIIDPWNELDHDRPNGMNLTEYTGYAIKEFRRLAKQYMITVIIVAHPTKMEKNKDGQLMVPTLYDISDSAHWFNKFEIGIVIHLLEGEEEGSFATLVRIEKIKYWGVIGKKGDRILEYMPYRGKYIDNPEFVPKRPKAATKAASAKAKKEKDEIPPVNEELLIGD